MFTKYKEFYNTYSKIVIFLFTFFVFLTLFTYNQFLFSEKELKVSFLDVGQGDGILIQTPKNKKILIDTGPNSKIVGEIETKISFFDKKLDVLLLTHQDLDHNGGFSDVTSSFEVKTVVVSKNYTERLSFSKISFVSKENLVKNKEVTLKILSPEQNDLGDTNHTSIVSQLIYGNFRFSFMADADKEVERKLVSEGYFENGKSYIDTVKLGHHGSDTASSELFLKKIKPEYCIFSVGKDNIYGHPSKSVLTLAEKYCASIYRTDEDGTVEFVTNGESVKIKKSLF